MVIIKWKKSKCRTVLFLYIKCVFCVWCVWFLFYFILIFSKCVGNTWNNTYHTISGRHDWEICIVLHYLLMISMYYFHNNNNMKCKKKKGKSLNVPDTCLSPSPWLFFVREKRELEAENKIGSIIKLISTIALEIAGQGEIDKLSYIKLREFTL